jgi:hypothetical protein
MQAHRWIRSDADQADLKVGATADAVEAPSPAWVVGAAPIRPLRSLAPGVAELGVHRLGPVEHDDDIG